MVYLPTFTIQKSTKCRVKYTIVPWIRIGIEGFPAKSSELLWSLSCGESSNLFFFSVGDLFTDCAMINHHVALPWGRIFYTYSKHLRQIQVKPFNLFFSVAIYGSILHMKPSMGTPNTQTTLYIWYTVFIVREWIKPYFIFSCMLPVFLLLYFLLLLLLLLCWCWCWCWCRCWCWCWCCCSNCWNETWHVTKAMTLFIVVDRSSPWVTLRKETVEMSWCLLPLTFRGGEDYDTV